MFAPDLDRLKADSKRFNGVVPGKRSQDRSLVLKACLLAQSQIPEAWLWEALEAVKVNKPEKPAAYFHRALSNLCTAGGVNLCTLLAGVRLPATETTDG